MPRYIDADALAELRWDADTRLGYIQVVDVGDIYQAPTADVAPVIYGKWEERIDERSGAHKICCTNCGTRDEERYPRCHECGAYMDIKS